jgi:hypothetical protein
LKQRYLFDDEISKLYQIIRRSLNVNGPVFNFATAFDRDVKASTITTVPTTDYFGFIVERVGNLVQKLLHLFKFVEAFSFLRIFVI